MFYPLKLPRYVTEPSGRHEVVVYIRYAGIGSIAFLRRDGMFGY